MSDFIKKVFLFMFFSALFYVLVLFCWNEYIPSIFKPNLNYRKGGYGHTWTRLQEIKKHENIDLLFLGSSHAYRGFDTRIYEKAGYKCFNAGSSSQTPTQTLVLLKRHLEKLNPKFIVYEVYPDGFSSDGVESAVDIIANDAIDKHAFKMALYQNNMKVYNTMIYAYIRQLFSLDKGFNEQIVKGDDTYIQGGFVEKKMSYFKSVSLPVAKIEFDEKQMTSFDECLKLISQKHIPIILVYAPVPPINYHRYSNNMEFDSTMKRYARYYNFNEILSLNDSLHFYDYHHLNQAGVEIFNTKLLEFITKNDLIKVPPVK